MDVIDFPDPRTAPDDMDLLAVSQFDIHGRQVGPQEPVDWPRLTTYGSTWSADVVLAAYKRGLFPMPFEIDNEPVAIGWWSPQPRAIFYPDRIRVTRSLEKSVRRYRTTVDKSFRDVVTACADPNRPHGWITDEVINAYCELNRRGVAHSVEVWTYSGELIGGLYGVEIGGVFAGESMFHTQPDASKVALLRLAKVLNSQTAIDGLVRVIDSQWLTDHLESLGATTILRADYCDLVEALTDVPTAFL